MPERSEYLHSQMNRWMETLATSERTEYLFELEMWLKSFERYFRVRNQALTEESTRVLALRSFYNEIVLVAQAVQRVTQLCTLLASEEQVSQERFDKYVESYMKKDDVTDPYIAHLLRQNLPQAGLALLRESFEDLHLVLSELSKLSHISYATFQSVGRLVYRDVRRSDYLKLLTERKFKPLFDRIGSDAVNEVIRRVEDPFQRRLVARIFLEFYRLLHYLNYADPGRSRTSDLRTTLLVFSLVTSESRDLLDYLRARARRLEEGTPLRDLIESFVYCIPLELRKVLGTELAEVSSHRQPEAVYVRIENSHGILRDCFQQGVVQLAQVFEPALEGREIFSNFATRMEQSVLLREDLVSLVNMVRRFIETRDELSAAEMKTAAETFYNTSLKFLMYRDWSGFELFYVEMGRCPSITGLSQIAHRFDTFLMTLLREVGKRAVFQSPAPPVPPCQELTTGVEREGDWKAV